MFNFFKRKPKTQAEVYININKISVPGSYFIGDRVIVLNLDGTTTIYENPEAQKEEIEKQIHQALIEAVKEAEITLNSAEMSEERK